MKLIKDINENISTILYVALPFDECIQLLSNGSLLLQKYSENLNYYYLNSFNSRKDAINESNGDICILQLNTKILDGLVSNNRKDFYSNYKYNSDNKILSKDAKINDFIMCIDNITCIVTSDKTAAIRIKELSAKRNIFFLAYDNKNDMLKNNRNKKLSL